MRFERGRTHENRGCVQKCTGRVTRNLGVKVTKQRQTGNASENARHAGEDEKGVL